MMSITHVGEPKGSQSLSSRAMSFDKETAKSLGYSSIVSIPFEQGDVFRLQRTVKTTALRNKSQSLSSRAMSFDKI